MPNQQRPKSEVWQSRASSSRNTSLNLKAISRLPPPLQIQAQRDWPSWGWKQMRTSWHRSAQAHPLFCIAQYSRLSYKTQLRSGCPDATTAKHILSKLLLHMLCALLHRVAEARQRLICAAVVLMLELPSMLRAKLGRMCCHFGWV